MCRFRIVDCLLGSIPGRGESCLLVGFTDAGKPVHVVCGRLGIALVIVTVYIPTPPKFKNPYERGA